MLNVLHVIPSVASVRGGPSQAVLEMVNALNTSGITAEIATTNDNGPDILDVPLNQRILYQNVPVQFFSRFSPDRPSAIREFAFSAPFTSWLWQHIQNYDLVHVHAIFSYPSTTTMAIARLKQVPYIVRPLGQLCGWSLQQSQRKKQIYLNLIEQANLNNAHAIHFTSDQEQKEASTLGLRTASFVLPHGLSIPKHTPDAPQQLRQHFDLPEDEPIILFLSRLHPKKGLELLISALKQIKECRFTCLIAGSGDPDYEAKLKAVVEQAGLTKRVLFTGFVQGDKKDLFIQGSNLFVLTSYSENFGVAVLEALAAGLPVMTTPGVALSQTIQQHHLGYVSELDPEAIASQIQQALNQPEKLQVMGDRARQFILENYTWDNVASQLVKTYQQILHSSSD